MVGFSVNTPYEGLFSFFWAFLLLNDDVELMPKARFLLYVVRNLHPWGVYPGVRAFFAHAVDILWILATRAWVY